MLVNVLKWSYKKKCKEKKPVLELSRMYHQTNSKPLNIDDYEKQ
ncbi:hypothetical protein QF042_002393 [Pedobacter sp. W3I1]|nr:hypothetical protein [Pedobacter sp. W3I1]